MQKVLYAINDFTLPFPVTFTQITLFVITEFTIIILGGLTAVITYRGGISEILWYSRCPQMVHEPENL